jgi:hypothetical protein
MKKVKSATLPRQMPPRDNASNWETGMDMNWLRVFNHIGSIHLIGESKKDF